MKLVRKILPTLLHLSKRQAVQLFRLNFLIKHRTGHGKKLMSARFEQRRKNPLQASQVKTPKWEPELSSPQTRQISFPTWTFRFFIDGLRLNWPFVSNENDGFHRSNCSVDIILSKVCGLFIDRRCFFSEHSNRNRICHRSRTFWFWFSLFAISDRKQARLSHKKYLILYVTCWIRNWLFSQIHCSVSRQVREKNESWIKIK